MGKALGSKNLMVAFFICNPPPLHGRSYEKSRKMSRDRTVDLKNDCSRPQDRPESWASLKTLSKYTKYTPKTSKCICNGRPRDSDHALGA